MANNGEKKIVKIEENPTKATAPENTGNQGQEAGTASGEEKVSFFRHPFKWTKKKFEEHPVAATVTTVGGVGLLALLVKCVADGLGGDEDCENDDENLDDEVDEEEDNEEDEN